MLDIFLLGSTNCQKFSALPFFFCPFLLSEAKIIMLVEFWCCGFDTHHMLPQVVAATVGNLSHSDAKPCPIATYPNNFYNKHLKSIVIQDSEGIIIECAKVQNCKLYYYTSSQIDTEQITGYKKTNACNSKRSVKGAQELLELRG